MGHIDNPEYVIPLLPIKEAIKLKAFIEEAREKNTTEAMTKTFFYVKRRAEEDLANDLEFQRRLLAEATKF